jgi:hypothetical protein
LHAFGRTSSAPSRGAQGRTSRPGPNTPPIEATGRWRVGLASLPLILNLGPRCGGGYGPCPCVHGAPDRPLWHGGMAASGPVWGRDSAALRPQWLRRPRWAPGGPPRCPVAPLPPRAAARPRAAQPPPSATECPAGTSSKWRHGVAPRPAPPGGSAGKKRPAAQWQARCHRQVEKSSALLNYAEARPSRWCAEYPQLRW